MKTSLVSVLLVVTFFVLSGYANKPKDDETGKVKYPPVSTFKSSCARCHGPQGSFYGSSFGELPEKELKRFVTLMMSGPGGLSPKRADIEAMTAYNMALARHKPFLFITSADTTATGINFSGESLPGSLVFLTGNGGTLQIKTGNNGKWQLGPVDPSAHSVFMVIEKTDTVKLEPGKGWWTK